MGLDDFINELVKIRDSYNLNNKTIVLVNDMPVLELYFDTTDNVVDISSDE